MFLLQFITQMNRQAGCEQKIAHSRESTKIAFPFPACPLSQVISWIKNTPKTSSCVHAFHFCLCSNCTKLYPKIKCLFVSFLDYLYLQFTSYCQQWVFIHMEGNFFTFNRNGSSITRQSIPSMPQEWIQQQETKHLLQKVL